jgi:hypothetical protein
MGLDQRFDEGLSAQLEQIAYHADETPDPVAWLALDEDMRRLAVEFFHHAETPHATAESPRLHAITHLIVENQIAADHPEVNSALKRLIHEGLSRHDALHAIGTVALAQLWQVTQEGREPDHAAYAATVDALTKDDWLALVGPPKHRVRRGRRQR